MAVEIHGMGPAEGETAFAFLVVRLREPVDRAGLVRVMRYLAPLVPDADNFIAELSDPLDEPMRIVGMPWTPPDAGHATGAQRRLVEQADAVGIEAIWFFQTGTSLPSDDDEHDEDEESSPPRRGETEDGWTGDSTSTKTTPITLVDEDDDDFDDVVAGELGGEDDDDEPHVDDEDDLEDAERAAGGDDDDAVWTNGPPPMAERVRFPVDGYPEIVDAIDWEDFGIAFKLAGPYTPGEGTVLLGFHTLWLAPYGGRYRNAAVTLDRTRHAAHLWVDRFAAPCSPDEQVHHLLWIVSKLDQVIPVVHARFGGASMIQKVGDVAAEPFVLGGNPLLAVHERGGEGAVDAWIGAQTEWSPREVGAMLRELAIELASPPDGEGDDELDETGVQPALGDDDEDDDGDGDDDEDDDGDDDDDGEDDDDDAEGNEDEDRGRQIAIYAGDLLRARASAGKLDARTADRLLPVLEQPEKFEHRRRAVVEILGALRHRAAVPALIKILDETTIKSSLDSIGKESFVSATAAALGAIGDPAAIPALARVVAAPGSHNDKSRPIAADALAACLAASPEPRAPNIIDDAVLGELLTTIRERNDGELNAESHFAYGRIARQLPPDRRAEARRRLLAADSARDDATAQLARQAALVLASPTADVDAPPRDLAPLLHEGLTSLDYDHDYTVRNLRVALRVAEVVPELADPDDLVWLTRFAEPDIRARAHALLHKCGKPMAAAPTFDRRAARALDDAELERLIGEPHVVGRAALVVEAGRRHLHEAHRAIIDACHDVISRARQGGANLLEPDTRVLETAVPILREHVDDEVISLFDRMLRHSNFHVKWELLQAAPEDDRLIGGMFHVLGERWGWQEKTAKQWLVQFQGTTAYEIERRRAGADLDEDDEGEGDEDDENEDDDVPSDEDVN